MSSVVGIDLGLQNTVLAAAGRGGVDIILNGSSNRLNPTMVGFDDCRKIGEMATSGVMSNYRNTILGMKRLVGLSFNDPRAVKEMQDILVNFVPVKRASGPDSIGVKVTLNGEESIVMIEAVYGMMIKHMGLIAAKKAAEGSLTAPDQLMPRDWVIAIPNYYTDAQRRAVLDGCEICGIEGIQRLMHENTATALAYGIFKDLKKEFTKEKPTNVLFIDFGASAYTVSIAVFEPGKLMVKSAFCDQDLGGRDFDMAIAKWLAAEFEKKFAGKLSGKPMTNPKSRLKLLAAAEKAKKTLSPQGVKEVMLNIEMVMDELDFHINLTAETYEKLCEPLLARLADPIKKALNEAGLQSKDLASVEIVGGSTRIGCVKRKLSEVLGCSLSTTMNADESVARGAALQSAILSPRFKVLPYEIIEAQPYPIKISWQDDDTASGMEVDAVGAGAQPTDSVIMFDRGLAFPIVRRVTLRRSGEFVVKSEYDETCVDYGLPIPHEIAEFTIKAPNKEETKVRVNVKQDIHGIIHMSSAQMVEEIEEDDIDKKDANNKESGDDAGKEKKKKIKKTNLDFTVRRPMSLTRDEINKANEKEVAMANNDRIVLETANMRNELESYIYDMRDKVASSSQLGPYGSDEEKKAFLSYNEKMENWLYDEGFDAPKSVYAEKLAELKKLGNPMEERQAEAQARPSAIQVLQANLDSYQKWVNDSQSDERYSHISDEEREKVRAITDKTSGWMYEMLDKQAGVALHQNPVLKISELKARNTELTQTCSPIMYKPLPKKKEAAVDDTKKGEGGSSEGKSSGAEPMEGVEKADENGSKDASTEMDIDK